MCPPKYSKSKKVQYEHLYFNTYGRNFKNFQHFIIEHLGPLIIAFRTAPKGTKFLVDLNKRSLEIVEAAGIPRSSLVSYKKGIKYCSRALYLDFVDPIDQFYLDHDEIERLSNAERRWKGSHLGVVPQCILPEHFVVSSTQLEDSFFDVSAGKRRDDFPRKYLIFASRKPPEGRRATAASGVKYRITRIPRPVRNIDNEDDIVRELKRIANINGLQFIYFQAVKYSIRQIQEIFLKGSIIVGAHGANMANQIFGGYNRSITVIEIVGTKWLTRYEDYKQSASPPPKKKKKSFESIICRKDDCYTRHKIV